MTESIRQHLEKFAATLPPGTHRVETTEGTVELRKEATGAVELKPLFAPLGNGLEMPWQFARVVVINRPDRPDRRLALETHLRELGWPFAMPLFHAATPGEKLTPPAYWHSTPQTWANLQSHLKVIREAYTAGAENVLVMEDDCLYLPGFLARVAYFLARVPEDWGMLMLGGRPGTHTACVQSVGQPGVHRISEFNNLESYAIHRRVMPLVIETLAATQEHSDVAFHAIQWEMKTFTMQPPLATQRAGWSDNFGVKKGHKEGRFEQRPEGAMILSTGEKRRHLLANSTASFRRNNPHFGLKVYSDHAWAGYDCEVVELRKGFESRAIKTQMLRKPPFSAGVMLDDDTVTLGTISTLATVLADCDLALAPDRYATIRQLFSARSEAIENWLGIEEREYTLKAWPQVMEMPHWNTGVIFYRDTPGVREFARVWHEEWTRFGRIDQIAFVRAVLRTGIRIGELPGHLHRICGPGLAPRYTVIAHVIGPKWELSAWLAANGLPDVAPPAELREGCCGEKRTLSKMAASLGRTLGGAAADALRGRRVRVLDTELEVRRGICRDCDRREGNRCGECGCFLSLAQPLARKSCPLGKWPPVASPIVHSVHSPSFTPSTL